MKVVAETLGVARSNLIDRLNNRTKPRRRYYTVKSGLWLVDVETVDQAWALVKADPFWPTGLRDRVEIKHWAQVFADGQALV